MTKYIKGKFIPTNPEKYVGDYTNIIYRSSWEKKLFVYLDRTPSILQWGSEETVIPYISPVDNRVHRYFVDVVVKYKTPNGIKRALLEVKPKAQTMPPKQPKRQTKRYMEDVMTYAVNQAKWKAAREFSEKNNCSFILLTEDELGIKR